MRRAGDDGACSGPAVDCAGTFRLPMVDVPDLIEVLRGGLQTAYEEHRSLLDRAFGENPAS